MKALDFLVNLKQSRDFDGNLESSLDEAIAELEALQQPKSCKRCIHGYCKGSDYNGNAIYFGCKLEVIDVQKHTFYCNRYEPKEQ